MSEQPSGKTIQASEKTLDVLAAILQANYVNGISQKEIAAACAISAPDVCRHVATLEGRGFVERLETGRLRGGQELARAGVRIMTALDAAARRIDQARGQLLRAD
jgi:DNA-binding IclR family transcriptional regulator